jgi:hypothetical protein
MEIGWFFLENNEGRDFKGSGSLFESFKLLSQWMYFEEIEKGDQISC